MVFLLFWIVGVMIKLFWVNFFVWKILFGLFNIILVLEFKFDKRLCEVVNFKWIVFLFSVIIDDIGKLFI